MEELIFFGVIILFSILDAIAKKKRQQQAGEVEAPEAEGWAEGEEGVSPWEPPTLEDPDDDGIPGEPLPRYTRSYRGGGEGDPDTSESMVPPDIWEEIGALARGEHVPEPPGEPEPEPWVAGPADTSRELPARIPTTSPIRSGQVGRREVGWRRDHAIHDSHAQYHTDPSERTPVQAPRPGGPSREVRAVRRALVEGGPSAARQAVILHEVLGKPLAYREEGSGGA